MQSISFKIQVSFKYDKEVIQSPGLSGRRVIGGKYDKILVVINLEIQEDPKLALLKRFEYKSASSEGRGNPPTTIEC